MLIALIIMVSLLPYAMPVCIHLFFLLGYGIAKIWAVSAVTLQIKRQAYLC